MAGGSLLAALKQYVGDALPGGSLTPELAPVRQYGNGVAQRAGQLVRDPTEFARQALLDVVPNRAEAQAAQARVMGGSLDPQAYSRYLGKIQDLSGLLGSMNVARSDDLSPVRVLIRAVDDPKQRPELRMLPSGDFELVRFSNLRDPNIRDRISDMMHDAYSPKYDHFFRFTNNRGELEIARDGLLRPSMNHVDNVPEAGVSVARGPHYSVNGYKYGYRLKGREIGIGSDGEPLIDPRSIVVLDEKLRPATKIGADGLRAIGQSLRSAGLSSDFFRRPVQVIWPD